MGFLAASIISMYFCSSSYSRDKLVINNKWVFLLDLPLISCSACSIKLPLLSTELQTSMTWPFQDLWQWSTFAVPEWEHHWCTLRIHENMLCISWNISRPGRTKLSKEYVERAQVWTIFFLIYIIICQHVSQKLNRFKSLMKHSMFEFILHLFYTDAFSC